MASMEPDVKDLNDLGAVRALTNEALALLWRGFKQGRFDRRWDAEHKRWVYQPREP
jgi:hypothetical protein